MINRIFTDIACKQRNCKFERICGDTFVYKRVANENYTIIVLSDGMGHGVKANILSTLTSTMLLNFVGAKADIRLIAEIILGTLPVCSVRKLSYSTFTVIYIDHKTFEVTIAEHDNPQTMIFRNNRPLETTWDCAVINSSEGRERKIKTTHFIAQESDRIVMMSDGVTQSGVGSDKYPFGWGRSNVMKFINRLVSQNLSAEEIATNVLKESVKNDQGVPKDDTSCVVVHLRNSRKLLLSSCPPSSRDHYKQFADTVINFNGQKIVCGYPVAEILASQLKVSITKEISSRGGLPPKWHIPGVELVTEGIVTLNKVYDILTHISDASDDDDPAFDICKMLLEADDIEILIGLKKSLGANIYSTDEFELRRNVLKNIGKILEKNFMKQVLISYL